jgi:hypothetical protein
MKNDQFISLLVTIVVAFGGSIVGYWATLRRDRLSKKRELRTQYLIEAYRRLESAGNTDDPDPRYVAALELQLPIFSYLGRKHRWS